MASDRTTAARVVRHQSGGDRWTMAHGPPDLRLAGHVLGYCDYDERTTSFTSRRELPSGRVVLIVNLGEPIGVRLEGAGGSTNQPRGFVAALHDSWAITTTGGSQRGVEVGLSPLGAYVLLGHPMHELARRVVTLEELFGARGGWLRERLGESKSVTQRFGVLDRFFLTLLDTARAPKPSVAYALDRLEQSRGGVPVGRLAEHLGCSRRHLIAGFREQVGVAPKLMARILRFEHAVELAGHASQVDWSEVSHRCGYYDQAHMIRDFRQFAGVTPGRWSQLRLPDGGGVRAEAEAAAA